MSSSLPLNGFTFATWFGVSRRDRLQGDRLLCAGHDQELRVRIDRRLPVDALLETCRHRRERGAEGRYADRATCAREVAVVRVEHRGRVLRKRRVRRQQRDELASDELGRGAAELGRHLRERGEVIVHERLAAEREDLAVGGQAVGLLRLGHLRVPRELAALVHLLKRRGLAEPQPLQWPEVGRRDTLARAFQTALVALVRVQQEQVAGVEQQMPGSRRSYGRHR